MKMQIWKFQPPCGVQDASMGKAFIEGNDMFQPPCGVQDASLSAFLLNIKKIYSFNRRVACRMHPYPLELKLSEM